MSKLTLFGLFAVTAMVVCYALERRNRGFVLAFSAACILGSVYGFLQGAWPFGIVELVWAAIAFLRWKRQSSGEFISPNGGIKPPVHQIDPLPKRGPL